MEQYLVECEVFSYHIYSMNYKCISMHESVEKPSREQLYVAEMYRTLSEKSP